MRQCIGNAMLDLGGVFDPDSANANRFGHFREVRILEVHSEIEKAGGLLLQLDEPERAVVEDDNLDRQIELHEAEEIAHQHGEAAVPAE